MSSRAALNTVAVLALVQGVLGVLRALQWFQVGSDLSHMGVVLLPILGVLAAGRGVLVGAIALLYVLFAWAAFTGQGWARGVGLAACALNALAVLGLLVTGAAPGAALLWLVVPVIIAVVLLRRPGLASA
jgi:hypothetical protein